MRKSKCTIILPDMHVPYHDKRALECAMRVVEYIKPDEVVLLGDGIDCTAWARHAPKMLKQDKCSYIDTDIKPMNLILDRLQDSTKKLVYISGNHEDWVEKWAANNTPHGIGSAIVSELAPSALLSKKSNGRARRRFEWIPYNTYLPHYKVAPNLWAVHGWSFAKNAANVHLEKSRTFSVIYGHSHRADYASMLLMEDDTMIEAWSDGCLASLKPAYMMHSPHNWSHGLSIVYHSRKNPLDWTRVQVRIKKGSAILGDGTRIC